MPDIADHETAYDTHLDIKFQPLEHIDLQRLADTAQHPWYNQTLCSVNDSVVRIVVMVEGSGIVPTGDAPAS